MDKGFSVKPGQKFGTSNRYHLGLILSLCLSFCPETVNAHPQTTHLKLSPQLIAQTDTRTQAQQLFDEGMQLFQEGTAESLQEAITKWDAALPLWRKLGDKAQEALINLALGRVYNLLGFEPQALEYYNQALQIYRKIEDRKWEATTLNQIGAVYDDLGEKQQALDYYQQALPLSRAVGDRSGESVTLNNIGLVYDSIGKPQEALNYYEQALPLSRAIGDRSGEATTLNNIGSVYDALGEKQQALDYYQQALPLSRAVGDRSGEATTLNNIGSVYDALGEKQQALDYYQQALPLSRAIGDRSGEATTLNNLGAVYRSIGQSEQALAFFQQALSITTEIGDRSGEADSYDNLGAVYSSLGKYETAISFLEKSLAIRKQHRQDLQNLAIEQQTLGPNNSNMVTTLNNLSDLYITQGSYSKAKQISEQALEIAYSINQGILLNKLRDSDLEQSQYSQILKSLEQLLEISRKTGDPVSEAATLTEMGEVYDSIGKPSEALHYYRQAILITKEVGDRQAEGNLLTKIGEVIHLSPPIANLSRLQDWLRGKMSTLTLGYTIEYRNGNIQNSQQNVNQFQQKEEKQFLLALNFYQQALSIYTEINDLSKKAETNNNIGSVYVNLGEYSKALNSYNEARVTFSNLKDSLGVGISFNNIGEVYRNLGDYYQALTYYEKALIPFQKLNKRNLQAATINNIGTVYNELGQYSTALNFYNKALVIQQEMTDKQGEGTTLHNLGSVYNKLEQNSTAQEYYQKALIIRREIKDNQGEALTLNNLGLLYNELGQHSQALDSLEKALKTFKELGDIPNEGNTLDSLGTVYKSLGEYNKALEYYQQALSIQQEIGNRTGEGIVLTNIGDLYQQQGNNSQAISFYQKAIDDVIETIFVDLRGEELQSSFANKHADTYARLINLLWDEGRYQEAFDYVERAKARSFLNQIANRPRDFRIDADVNLLKQEQELRDEINTLNNQLIALNSSIISEKTTEGIQQQLQNKVANIKSTLTTRQQDYSKLLQQIKRNNPETADLVTVNPAKLEEIQSLLDKDTTLVEYFVTEDRILAFIVTHKTLIPVTLFVSKKDLQTTIDTLYEYDFATLENAHPHSLKQLHQNLISPLQPYLSTSKIAIVTHNLLHYIPFAALTDGENYLSDNYDLFNLPSASIMRFLEQKRKPQSGTLMALGNPTFDLPFAKQEVETISAMYGNEPLTGQKANENTLWSQAAQTGILHLATHGEYNPISPLFSTLYFVPGDGYDGRLETHEIYGLNLQSATNLVVLSACQTQIGKVSDGDEVVALNRAFLYAGTPSVVASLWNVDDESTSLLMQQFYGYLRGGKSKAEALKLAQQDTRRKYPHPYYWAGFVLTGDSGKLIAE